MIYVNSCDSSADMEDKLDVYDMDTEDDEQHRTDIYECDTEVDLRTKIC